ncbi:MAG: hypothetical protein IJS13_06825 [Paludibacteraceae bacterium]|nr:hypothetical protein [Paludibacteraceae bacterium]
MVQQITLHEDAFNSIKEQFDKGETATIATRSLQGFHLGDTIRIFEIKNGYDISNVKHRAAKKSPYTGREMRCFVKACYVPDEGKGYGIVLKKEE